MARQTVVTCDNSQRKCWVTWESKFSLKVGGEMCVLIAVRKLVGGWCTMYMQYNWTGAVWPDLCVQNCLLRCLSLATYTRA